MTVRELTVIREQLLVEDPEQRKWILSMLNSTVECEQVFTDSQTIAMGEIFRLLSVDQRTDVIRYASSLLKAK